MADDDSEVVIDLHEDVLMGAVRHVQQFFRVAKPAVVQAVDRAASRITAALRVRFIGTDLRAHDEPEVPDVPVVYYGGGGYVVAMDMRQDDPCVVVCCDGPVRGFYENGEAVTPSVGQGHDYGSAVAFPGGRVSSVDQPTPPANAPGELLVGAVDGSAAVILRGAGLPSPAELGTVVVNASGPLASILLGSTGSAAAPAIAGQVEQNMLTLNSIMQAIPTTGNPIADQAVKAVQIAFGSWAASLSPMGDLKVRMDGAI